MPTRAYPLLKSHRNSLQGKGRKMIQWKPGLLIKVRVMTPQLGHWKEEWHLYTFLYWVCLYIFGRQQTAGKIRNIMFFTICHSALRFLSLTWIFEKWETYTNYDLCGCLTAKFQSTCPECSTSQQHKGETFTPICEVAEEPLCKASAELADAATAIVPSLGHI